MGLTTIYLIILVILSIVVLKPSGDPAEKRKAVQGKA